MHMKTRVRYRDLTWIDDMMGHSYLQYPVISTCIWMIDSVRLEDTSKCTDAPVRAQETRRRVTHARPAR